MIKKSNNFKLIKGDPKFHEKFFKLQKLTEAEQGSKLNSQEMTRRLLNTRGFEMSTKEILEDARLKKELKGRRKMI